jgi:hypothetical protein
MTTRKNKKKTGFILLVSVCIILLPLWNLYNQLRLLWPLWVQDYDKTTALSKNEIAKWTKLLPSSSFSDELHFIVQHAPNATGCGGCDVLNELIPSLKNLGFHVFGKRGIRGCPNPASIEGVIPLNRTLVFVKPGRDRAYCPPLFPNRSSITVHWILGPPGVMGPPLKDLGYKWDDLVFSYAPHMIEAHSYKNSLMVLKNPVPGDETDIPHEVFYNKNRSGILWTMRKGKAFHSNITYIHEHSGISSTNREREQPIKVEDLVKYEYFVTYDPQTYLTELAAMSGTVSIVYPVAGQTKEQWFMNRFQGPYLHATGNTVMPGVAYGWNDSEISFARRTMHQARPFLVDMKRWGVETTVARFARDCYRYKNGARTNFEAGLLVKDAFPSLFKQDA